MHKVFVLLFCGFVGLSVSVYAEEPDYCSGLEDIIRSAVDGIPPHHTSFRLMVALEAHKRLNCDPKRLIEILHLN